MDNKVARFCYIPWSKNHLCNTVECPRLSWLWLLPECWKRNLLSERWHAENQPGNSGFWHDRVRFPDLLLHAVSPAAGSHTQDIRYRYSWKSQEDSSDHEFRQSVCLRSGNHSVLSVNRRILGCGERRNLYGKRKTEQVGREERRTVQIRKESVNPEKYRQWENEVHYARTSFSDGRYFF